MHHSSQVGSPLRSLNQIQISVVNLCEKSLRQMECLKCKVNTNLAPDIKGMNHVSKKCVVVVT